MKPALPQFSLYPVRLTNWMHVQAVKVCANRLKGGGEGGGGLGATGGLLCHCCFLLVRCCGERVNLGGVIVSQASYWSGHSIPFAGFFHGRSPVFYALVYACQASVLGFERMASSPKVR